MIIIQIFSEKEMSKMLGEQADFLLGGSKIYGREVLEAQSESVYTILGLPDKYQGYEREVVETIVNLVKVEYGESINFCPRMMADPRTGWYRVMSEFGPGGSRC